MRYFIVFFEANILKQGEEEETRRGHIGFPFKKFPSFRSLSEQICDVFGFTDAVVMNLLEVSEEDYNNWMAEGGDSIEDFL